jgi:hypothetical protein
VSQKRKITGMARGAKMEEAREKTGQAIAERDRGKV